MAKNKKTKNGQNSMLRVFFGKNTLLKDTNHQNTIVITPTTDNWNDFGHQTYVEYAIQLEAEEKLTIVKAHIGFILPAIEGIEKLRDHPAFDHTTPVPVESVKYSFFTMLQNMEDYRQIVSMLGPEDAQRVLCSVNDLVALREFKTSEKILEQALETEVFSRSFMRNSDSYFAYKNAGPLLRGLSNEQKGLLSSSLGIKFRLPGRANAHELNFTFDHSDELPKRFSVLIGKNGVGKSQALGRIAKAALGGD